ncbi:MAG TPA: FliO/MopB family protein [Clostridia bacterium]|jgi:flagellar biogenesis protein FliO|nr:flagellar biosynthetic protein FliO [Clostridia bacterium]HHY06627.1 FliO/MopB family protein [Clostridia bacterium]
MLITIFFTVTQPENPEINNVVSYPSVAALFFRVILTLLFIIFVTYFILRFVKRQQNLQQNQKNWVKIFDYQALGANQGLYLMEIYDLTCIVAVSDGQINILKEIETNTKKWEEIKNSLSETEDLFVEGIGRLFPRKKTSQDKKHFTTKGDFQQQLAEQFRRNQHLSRGVFQGRNKDE